MNDTPQLTWSKDGGPGHYRLDRGKQPTGMVIVKIPEWHGYNRPGWRVLLHGRSLTVQLSLGRAKKWGFGFWQNQPQADELAARLAEVEDYENTVAGLRRGEM